MKACDSCTHARPALYRMIITSLAGERSHEGDAELCEGCVHEIWDNLNIEEQEEKGEEE